MNIEDADQRALALTPNRSFICEAPAGSGKTELLTQRILKLLARVEHPESVLAITFTRKAAAEMRDRVVEALLLAAGDKPIDDHKVLTWSLAKDVLETDQKYSWNILKNPRRLNISTFDSLCSWINQTLPLASKIGIDVNPSEDSEALYEEASDNFLASLDENPAWQASLNLLLSHLDVRVELLKNLFVNLLASRDTWMPLIYQAGVQHQFKEVLERNLYSVVHESLAQMARALEPEADNIKSLVAFAANNLSREDANNSMACLMEIDCSEGWPLATEEGLKQWKAIKDFFLKTDGHWRKKLDKRNGFPTGENKEEKLKYKELKQQAIQCIERVSQLNNTRELLLDVAALPDLKFEDGQWRVLEALFEALPVLVAHLQLVFARRGEVDFIEVAARARMALGAPDNPTDLTLKLDHAIQHILVDEFQDTSFSQIELIERLTAGWEQGDERSLFCVGDAMQSIYGFRGAKVGLFLFAKQAGIGDIKLENLRLSSNFRSEKPIIDWVNKNFQIAFPQENDIGLGAVSYSPSVAYKTGQDAGVYSWAFVGQQALEEEAKTITQEVQSILQSDPVATVSVLVKSRSHAAQIVEEFKNQSVDFKAVDLESLAAREEIRDLLSLTLALMNVERRVEWLAVLRAPWCGLLLKDLNVVANWTVDNKAVYPLVMQQIQQALYSNSPATEDLNRDQQLALFNSESPSLLSDDGRNRLERCYRVFSRALADRQRKPLYQWVEGVWIELGGPDCLRSEIAKQNVERYFEFLQSLTQIDPWPSAEEICKKIKSLYSAPDPKSDGRVQIMTIHKSKGLEFDYVFLPSLQSAPRREDESLILFQERVNSQGEDEILFAPISAYGQQKDSIYNFISNEQKKRKRLEECRLLYVACTRAKKYLYLSARLDHSEKDEERFKPPSKGSLLSYLWPGIELSMEEKSSSANKDQEPWQEKIEDQENIPEIDLSQREMGGLSYEQWTQKYPHSSPLFRLKSTWDYQTVTQCNLLENYIPFSDYSNTLDDIDWYSPESSNLRAAGTVTHFILQQAIERHGDFVIEEIDEKDQKYFQSMLLEEGVLAQELDVIWADMYSQLKRLSHAPVYSWLMANSHHCMCEYAIVSEESGEFSTFIVDLLLAEPGGATWVIDYKTANPHTGESTENFYKREMETYRAKMMSYARAVSLLGYGDVKCALLFVATGELKSY